MTADLFCLGSTHTRPGLEPGFLLALDQVRNGKVLARVQELRLSATPAVREFDQVRSVLPWSHSHQWRKSKHSTTLSLWTSEAQPRALLNFHSLWRFKPQQSPNDTTPGHCAGFSFACAPCEPQ